MVNLLGVILLKSSYWWLWKGVAPANLLILLVIVISHSRETVCGRLVWRDGIGVFPMAHGSHFPTTKIVGRWHEHDETLQSFLGCLETMGGCCVVSRWKALGMQSPIIGGIEHYTDPAWKTGGDLDGNGGPFSHWGTLWYSNIAWEIIDDSLNLLLSTWGHPRASSKKCRVFQNLRLDKSFAASETQEEMKVGQKLRAARPARFRRCLRHSWKNWDLGRWIAEWCQANLNSFHALVRGQGRYVGILELMTVTRSSWNANP